MWTTCDDFMAICEEILDNADDYKGVVFNVSGDCAVVYGESVYYEARASTQEDLKCMKDIKLKFDALKWKDEGSDHEDEEGFNDKEANQKNSGEAPKDELDESFEDFENENDEEYDK